MGMDWVSPETTAEHPGTGTPTFSLKQEPSMKPQPLPSASAASGPNPSSPHTASTHKAPGHGCNSGMAVAVGVWLLGP